MIKIKYIFYTILFFVFTSCSRIQYVPIEKVKTEYVNIYTSDTIIQNNAIYIKEKGDTIYIKETNEIYKYRDRVDTCIIKDTTTQIVYRDVVEYVEINKVKDWQIILMVLGGLFIGIIGHKLIRIIKK